MKHISTTTNCKSKHVFLNMPSFKRPKKIGTLKDETYRLTPKRRHNLFHLFGDGIGVNSEVINTLDFKFIECLYEGKLLRTTKEHFVKKAIPSPFFSDKVDHQFILRLIDWVIPACEMKDFDMLTQHNEGDQLSLFEEVA